MKIIMVTVSGELIDEWFTLDLNGVSAEAKMQLWEPGTGLLIEEDNGHVHPWVESTGRIGNLDTVDVTELPQGTRAWVAQNQHTSLESFEKLAMDASTPVRVRVAGAAPASIALLLVDDKKLSVVEALVERRFAENSPVMVALRKRAEQEPKIQKMIDGEKRKHEEEEEWERSRDEYYEIPF